ncbi:MAG: ribosomal protein L7/L12 [Alphaproteobacteria bacterium]|nr:ribosomal protein L7/L12 [Alphaproteobacteria bacterium]
MNTLTREQVVAWIKGLSHDELVDFIEVLTEALGMEEREPRWPYIPHMGVSLETVGEPYEIWSLHLRAAGPQKLQVVKALRKATGRSLKETLDLVNRAPVDVFEREGERERVEALAEELRALGADVVVR